MDKLLMLGNEAVARGAWEAGVLVATAYPGTPSTEITEEIAKYDEVYAEWAPNEKVAMEAAIGASIAGSRAIVCMKHVGMNVAADPMFTAAYTGVNGGLVIVVADDPGMHSSQNEQDSRFYARSAHIPMLEPSDSQEALDFTKLAFEISEKYDTPVLLRLTTRVSHSRALVSIGERKEFLHEYTKDINKYVMMPGMARKRHIVVEQRMNALSQDCNALPINFMEEGTGSVGVIASGITYQYVKEALPTASVLKLGMAYPLPMELIRTFAEKNKDLVVVEELEPFIEDAVKAAGVACRGKELFTVQGEYSTGMIAGRLGGEKASVPFSEQALPARPPVMCPGCPHRGAYYAMARQNLVVTGDIGCYTLGALKPLESMHSCICMGASIGMAHGMEKARGREFAKKLVAVIGDSTFIHSGITGVIEAVYNGSNITIMILDNSTTGMTGHQDHPATGKGIKGNDTYAINLEALCRSLGVASVRVVDPFDLKSMDKALKEAREEDGVSVIISRRPCALLKTVKAKKPLSISSTDCKKCLACMKLGCPAIALVDGMPTVDQSLCTGCGLCVGVCPFHAIGEEVQS